MMEAARTSETSDDNYFTRQYIPEDKFELHSNSCLLLGLYSYTCVSKLSAMQMGAVCSFVTLVSDYSPHDVTSPKTNIDLQNIVRTLEIDGATSLRKPL
jgi:hypothetical protein